MGEPGAGSSAHPSIESVEVVEVVVDALWDGRRRQQVAVRIEDGLLMDSEADPAALVRLPVTLLPGVVDHHVHLGLVDRERLAGGPVVEVHDLGWVPDEALAWRARPPSGVSVRVAGPFHTAPGGYPSGRAWAPAGAVRALRDPADARAAVAEASEREYDLVKVALHDRMPLLDDAVLSALVEAAHAAGLPVVVHAEGRGQAARAVAAGADVLAHAPWTERLPDDLLERAAGMVWVSTVAIHDGEDRSRALHNLARFHAAGGRVAYGTDMGNGPTPVGPHDEEILALGDAGLSGDVLLRALTGAPALPVPVERLLVSTAPLPDTASQAVAWLAGARRLTTADLDPVGGGTRAC